ncbi:MAG: hypothetical protein AB7N76_13715 [Planctomycetota bacterium]
MRYLDPWRSPYRVLPDGTVASLGPDRRWGTQDDVLLGPEHWWKRLVGSIETLSARAAVIALWFACWCLLARGIHPRFFREHKVAVVAVLAPGAWTAYWFGTDGYWLLGAAGRSALDQISPLGLYSPALGLGATCALLGAVTWALGLPPMPDEPRPDERVLAPAPLNSGDAEDADASQRS